MMFSEILSTYYLDKNLFKLDGYIFLYIHTSQLASVGVLV